MINACDNYKIKTQEVETIRIEDKNELSIRVAFDPAVYS